MFSLFVKRRLDDFGQFQDSINEDAVLLFHSGISSSLNIGLITIEEIVEKVQRQKTHAQNKEGFLRQILGWR